MAGYFDGSGNWIEEDDGSSRGTQSPTSSTQPVGLAQPAGAAPSTPSYTDVFNPVFDNSPSGVINQRNPEADPGRAFVQAGNTGGYLAGTGVTIGEGRSTTPAQAQSAYEAGIAKYGADAVNDFLKRNSGDFNRIDEGLGSEWGGAGLGLSREQSGQIQGAGGSFTDVPGMGYRMPDGRTSTTMPGGMGGAGGTGTGQTWGGNWFDDPATQQLEDLIKGQLNQLTNPGANDPQAQLMSFIQSRFQELAGSNGYSPQELALLRTQGAEPIEDLRKTSQQRELVRTARAGYLPSSGITLDRQKQTDVDYDRMRTQASRDLAVQNINERSNRLNQAAQLGQSALGLQRGTQGQQLQLSTLLQQLPVQALQQAMSVLGGTSQPENLAQIVAQMTAANNQQQMYANAQNQQMWSNIGLALADLFD